MTKSTKNEFIESLKELEQSGLLTVRSNLSEADYKKVYLINAASFGDYDSSGPVERANHAYISNRYKDLPYLHVYEGNYGYKTIWIREDLIDNWIFDNSELAAKSNQLIEQLAGLSDYPVLCDGALTKTETEMVNEAWEDCYKTEFLEALHAENHNLNLIDLEYNHENLRTLFDKIVEEHNFEWAFESGGNVYIDVHKVASYVELDEIHNVFYVDFSENITFDTSADSIAELRESIEYLENYPYDGIVLESLIESETKKLNKLEKEKLNENKTHKI